MSDPGQTVHSDFARAATGPLPAIPISSLPEFRFGRRIGAGGMGVVVMGERISDGRPVAIKLLRADLVDDPEFRERFRREVAVMRAVEHPNVVGILDAGEHQGWLYLVTELMRDGDLAAYQRRRGSLLAKDALTMAIKIGRGLAAIHRAGLIHRDVKPQNVFLDHRAGDGGEVKVGDLGMARSASGDDRMTMTGAACGTPTYMAPEQVRGVADLDARVDVYALGTLLWTLLAGREPFIGDTVFVVTEAVLNQPAPDLGRFATAMPPGTIEVVRKAMAKDRAQRYATMDELVTDLERLVAGERPVQAGVVAAPAPVTATHAKPKTAIRIGSGSGGGGGLGGGGLRLSLQALAVLVLLGGPLVILSRFTAAPGATTSAEPPAAPAKRARMQVDRHGVGTELMIASVPFALRWCPPGDFQMGSPPDERDRGPWESVHRVRLSQGFWLMATELSQEQYRAITGQPGASEDAALPVTGISASDAEHFLAALNAKLPGLSARLPSEAEWEYACRAGSHGAFAMKLQPPALPQRLDELWRSQPLDRRALPDDLLSALRWVSDEPGFGPRTVEQPVANAWGVRGMHDNVQEWCRDRWDHASDDGDAEVTDPCSTAGAFQVVRGGSWAHPPDRMRCAARDSQEPDAALPWIGLRFVVPGGADPAALPTGGG